SEREWVRDRIDQLDNMLYAETAATGLEFISPHDVWVGHEPCGRKGEFTNEINLSDLTDLSGSFHPNRKGAHQLAVLIDTPLPAPRAVAPLPPRPPPPAAAVHQHRPPDAERHHSVLP